MKDFGNTVRDLRIAQDLGLRDAATKVGISPAYLSRIERGKEKPPSPEIIKNIAKVLAADPDVLFRLAASTDPAVSNYLQERPELLLLVRFLDETQFSAEEIKKLQGTAHRIVSKRAKDRQTAAS